MVWPRPTATSSTARSTCSCSKRSNGPLHGYAIAVRLEQTSKDVLSVEEGSLYPALYRMEARDWLSSSWAQSDTGRRARFYKLTRKGRAQLEDETESWLRLTTAVASGVLKG